MESFFEQAYYILYFKGEGYHDEVNKKIFFIFGGRLLLSKTIIKFVRYIYFIVLKKSTRFFLWWIVELEFKKLFQQLSILSEFCFVGASFHLFSTPSDVIGSVSCVNDIFHSFADQEDRSTSNNDHIRSTPNPWWNRLKIFD